MKTYLLIDGKNCLYRHNYTSNLTTSDGQKISGTFGMLKDVTNLVRTYSPDMAIICWDKGRSQERLALYPEYKANRKKDDKEFLENIRFQTQTAKELFSLLPVMQITVENTEADDIIGLLCNKLEGKKIIASNDSDFMQLVNKDTIIVKSRKSVIQEINESNIEEELGYPSKFYVVHKALVGDSSDNIQGVGGIGDKTATKIILRQIKKTFDLDIHKRNMRLIKIGHLLTKEQKLKIVEVYKEQLKKEPNLFKLKLKLQRLRFNSLLMNFEGIMECYKKMYLKQRGKNGKS